MRWMLLLGLATLAAADDAAPRYRQALALTFASPADAQAAQVALAPVHGGKTWAFSARWDDNNANNLEMRRRMAKHGLRGTFYLTNTDERGRFGAEYARQVTEDGFSVGGHGETHAKLNELTPNAMWKEIMGVRVQRESQLDVPINSYTFAYGIFKDNDDPTVQEAVTACVARAGYNHATYASFVKDNPYLTAGEIGTSWQVVPGDRAVDAAKFNEQLDKIVNRWPEGYRELSHGIHLGVHAWQQGEVWDDLEAVFATLSGRDDWWYCNLTQWAAYQHQARHTHLEPTAGSAATERTFTLARPLPADLGDDVPLTLVVTGAAPTAASVDGRPLELKSSDAGTLLDLPHTQGQALPTAIAALDMGALTADAEPQAVDELGVRAALRHVDGELVLVLSAPAELRDLRATLRLPPVYEEGVLRRELPQVAAGGEATIGFTLPAERDGERWQAGERYVVAEVDYTGAAGAQRLFVTGTIPAP